MLGVCMGLCAAVGVVCILCVCCFHGGPHLLLYPTTWTHTLISGCEEGEEVRRPLMEATSRLANMAACGLLNEESLRNVFE